MKKTGALQVMAALLLSHGSTDVLAQPGTDPLSPTSPNAPTANVAPDNNAPLRPEELEALAYLEPGGKEVKIEVVNKGKRGLLILGDSARLEHGNINQTPLKRNAVVPPPKRVAVPGDILYVAGSLATIGAGPSLQDYIQRKQATQGLVYGLDEDRRQVAGLRFGKRIVFPGETSAGRFYLEHKMQLPMRILIKVTSHPDGEDLGTMVLPVAAGAGGDPRIREFDAFREKPIKVKGERLTGADD